MIESICISKVATFQGDDQLIQNPSKFNFIFGCNGSGKTTISRVIADIKKYPSCKLIWKHGRDLEICVYNQDFVEENFHQSSKLKGVFTLGEGVGIKEQIVAKKTELANIENKIGSLKSQINALDENGNKIGKNIELLSLEEDLKNKCWEQKKKHDSKLQGGFKGYRGSAEEFKKKVLQEISSNSAILLTKDELERKAAVVFSQIPLKEDPIQFINFDNLLKHESNNILDKRILGKDEVDIAAIIKKLGNSDWVRNGRSFYEINDGVCPFCQQTTNEKLSKSLNEYFDEAFESDNKSVEDLLADYKTDSERIKNQLTAIIGNQSKILDSEKEKLKIEKEIFESKVAINLQKLAEKKKEPSGIFKLESLTNIALSIKSIISDSNFKILEHNKLVENIANEIQELTAQIWKFILEEMRNDLDAYLKKSEYLKNSINQAKKLIAEEESKKNSKELEIATLERQITSIQPTLKGINDLLLSIGFRSFSLSLAEDKISYKIIRSDGSDAKNTLSEGEKSFITFLYFYYLISGSNSSDGITKDRVVVIDDPISSLDSNILFVVSSLIERLFEGIKDDKGNVKQIFILTHNTYFHKEVSFHLLKTRKNKAGYPPATFWVVRKSGLISQLEWCDKNNPISSSYQLLWSDVKKKDPKNITIANTLRRILEHYFKILGGIDPDEICEMFHENDKFVCKSLFSWVNAGSHEVFDDVHISDNGVSVDTYLRVFEEIFQKSNHESHYKMMMRC